jgi:hypothetical protein
MGTYQINEGAFELPDGWPDQTVNIFTTSREAPAEFSLVISRDEELEGEELRDYVARQHKTLYEQLPRLRMLRRGEAVLDGQPAVDVEFTWESDAGVMRQRQLYVAHDGAILTLTATAREAFYTKYETAVDDLTASFKFRQ